MLYHVYAQPYTGEELIESEATLKWARQVAVQHVATTRDPVEITYEDGEPKTWYVWNFKTKRIQEISPDADLSGSEYKSDYGIQQEAGTGVGTSKTGKLKSIDSLREGLKTARYSMYCPHCQEWIMAAQSVGDWHKTSHGAGKYVYTCPKCDRLVIPEWENVE